MRYAEASAGRAQAILGHAIVGPRAQPARPTESRVTAALPHSLQRRAWCPVNGRTVSQSIHEEAAADATDADQPKVVIHP